MMKKLMTLLVAMLMVFSLTAKANAEDTYTIKIDNAVEGETYNAYKIFDVTYADPVTPAPTSPSADAPNPDQSHMNNAYSYTIEKNSYWWTVIVGNTAAATDGTYTANGLKFSPTANGTTFIVQDAGSFDAAALAVVLNAAASKPTADASGTATATLPLTLTVAKAGYYFVDTTLGSLCSLDTTEPSATIREKNLTTAVEKTVKEDSTGSFGKWNDADYGQEVEFKSVVTIGAHQKNVVYHDKLSANLTLSGNVTVTGAATGKYTVVSSPTDGCTFEVKFDTTWTEGLTSATEVTITYKATVTLNALIGEQTGLAMGAGNDNVCYVTFGKAQETEKDWTRTYVWEFDLFKFTGTDDTPVKDAVFNLMYSNAALPLVQLSNETIDGVVFAVYRLATSADTSTVTDIVTPASGKVIIRGLDADVYYLKETEAPKGYNKLKEDVKVTLTSAAGQTVPAAVLTVSPDVDGFVKIKNETGTELPATGGIGTTIFHVAGALMVLGAGIYLVAKKKVNN